MPRAPAKSLDTRLAAVRTTTSLDELRDALRSATGVLVAAAAARVAADGLGLRALVDEFAPAFDRLCDKPNQRDPGCRGKLALAQALYDLDRWDDLFERGVRHVQREPEWGGARDTAGDLRGLCALAHAHFVRRDALDVLAGLLADPDRSARAAAAQALGNAGRPDATAVLRLKLLVGDDEPAVLAACFESLLGLSEDGACEFVGTFLRAHDERAEVAVLALGASRLEAAHPLIAAWTTRALAEQRGRVGYIALALLRREAATAELVDVVAHGEVAEAVAAARALATFKDDHVQRARIVEAAAGRDRATRADIERLL